MYRRMVFTKVQHSVRLPLHKVNFLTTVPLEYSLLPSGISLFCTVMMTTEKWALKQNTDRVEFCHMFSIFCMQPWLFIENTILFCVDTCFEIISSKVNLTVV